MPVTLTASQVDEEARGYHVPEYPCAVARAWQVTRIASRPPRFPVSVVLETKIESSSFVLFQLISQVAVCVGVIVGVEVGVGVPVGVDVSVGVFVGVGVLVGV